MKPKCEFFFLLEEVGRKIEKFLVGRSGKKINFVQYVVVIRSSLVCHSW